MKFFRILFLLLGLAMPSFSTEIAFHFPGNSFERIKVYQFEDEFSRTPRLLVDTVTDATGRVKFSVNCSAITPVEFRTSTCMGKWYLEPGSAYALKMQMPDTSVFRTANNLPEVIIFNENPEKKCLSDSIRIFEDALDLFYRENAPFFVQPRLLAKSLSKFKSGLNQKFNLTQAGFFSTYVKYMIAPVEEAALQNKPEIIRKYFSSSFQFKHPAWVSYFKQFFKKYCWIVSNKSDSNFLMNDINDFASLELLNRHLIENDSLITNDTLRQMILIYNLSEVFYEKNYNRSNIEKMLAQLSRSKAITPLHALVAKNTLANLTFFDRGNPAPDFSLPLANGKIFELKQLSGNWTFVSFVSAWDAHSISEVKALNKIAVKYGLKVKFVYVVLEGNDDELIALQRYIPEGGIMLDDRKSKITPALYKVNQFPRFFYLDPDLTIYNAKSPAPSEGLEGFLKLSLKK